MKTFEAVALLAIHILVAIGAVVLVSHFGWYVSGYLGLVLAILSLLARQSFALHRGDHFTEIVPLEVRHFADGTKQIRLLQYLPKTDEFTGYLDS